MEDYEQFLLEINNLSVNYKKSKIFNAFLSIGIYSQETMHSRFIGMLLNPKGEHKHKDIFLKLFLEHIGITEIENADVKCERSANGRWIDIAIENSKSIIIIENKILADDQPHQMVDYYNFALTTGKQVFMVYLTINGRMPSDDSLGEGILPIGIKKLPKEDVICISYEKHIIEWIEECLELLKTNLSISQDDNLKIHYKRLKTSLEMYEDLIRTVIKRDKYMNEILNNLLSNPKHMELAIDIVKALQVSFLDNPKIRKSIIDQIETAARGYFDPDPYDRDKSWTEIVLDYEEKKGSICFTESHIYAKRDGVEEPFNEINCFDINDPNLVNLLTQNTAGVNEWMKQVYEQL